MKIFLMLHQNFLQIDYIAMNKIDKLILDFMRETGLSSEYAPQLNAVASNSITITSLTPPLCKIASAQFCNKQITNTVSHNKKEQIPNGTCSFFGARDGT